MNVHFIYLSRTNAITFAEVDYSSGELIYENIRYQHIRSDHYDLILSESGELVGFQLSLKNDKTIDVLLSKHKSKLKVHGKKSHLVASFLLRESRELFVDEIQDFCEIFSNEDNDFGIVLLNVFNRQIIKISPK